MSSAVAFACGLVFAVGLGLAGMTDPARVIGFLDVFGRWDPTLAFVMGGAVAITAAAFPAVLRRKRPVLASEFALPRQRRVDGALVLGAATFGVGWALAGYCPGPAIVSLATRSPGVALFVAAMTVGLAAGRWTVRRLPQR